LEEIVEFHYRFESIHPFQDGNGRVGRLVLFKECLGTTIVPFIIDDEFETVLLSRLAGMEKRAGILMDTCFAAQDKFRHT
jgi:hypothetical protein